MMGYNIEFGFVLLADPYQISTLGKGLVLFHNAIFCGVLIDI